MRPPGALLVLKLFVFVAKAAPLHTSSAYYYCLPANKTQAFQSAYTSYYVGSMLK